MAYDEVLAERIRDLLVGESARTEKKMFGGLAFLVGGNMAVAASGQGGLLVRVDPDESDRLVARTTAGPWTCGPDRWSAGFASTRRRADEAPAGEVGWRWVRHTAVSPTQVNNRVPLRDRAGGL